jgi:hypothetical protein
MELGWEGATTTAREEARKEDVLEMLRALVEDFRRGVQAWQLKELQDEEAERLERRRAEQGKPHEVAAPRGLWTIWPGPKSYRVL